MKRHAYGGKHPVPRHRRAEMEEQLLKEFSVEQGSVIQRQEALPFKQENGGSNPSGPTNMLVAKKCSGCDLSMYIHKKVKDIVFTNCEPSIIKITIERVAGDKMCIKGRRSTKTVRCQGCKRRHKLNTFAEVENNVV